jgi:hypothetical protein
MKKIPPIYRVLQENLHTYNLTIDGYGSKSTNSDLAKFYLLLYIRQHAGLFRRRTNVNDVFDNKKIVSWQ